MGVICFVGGHPAEKHGRPLIDGVALRTIPSRFRFNQSPQRPRLSWGFNPNTFAADYVEQLKWRFNDKGSFAVEMVPSGINKQIVRQQG